MTAEKTARRLPPAVKWGAIVVGALLAAAVAGFLIWALTPLGPTPEALAALESGQGVSVSENTHGWVFTPLADEETTCGLVFYPGGRVDPRSYAPFARELAARGHHVAIAKMPLSLAVFNSNAADDFIGAPGSGVRFWAVGGHSLGGAMAAQYAGTHRVPVTGLLLLASYASGDRGDKTDMSQAKMAAADVTGTNDGVLNRANWKHGQTLLPKETVETVISGGNHAQFGDYGPQPGDNPATISAEEQRARAVDAADVLLRSLDSVR